MRAGSVFQGNIPRLDFGLCPKPNYSNSETGPLGLVRRARRGRPDGPSSPAPCPPPVANAGGFRENEPNRQNPSPASKFHGSCRLIAHVPGLNSHQVFPKASRPPSSSSCQNSSGNTAGNGSCTGPLHRAVAEFTAQLSVLCVPCKLGAWAATRERFTCRP